MITPFKGQPDSPGDPRAFFMRHERIGNPKGTRPFNFRRVSAYANEWRCAPHWETIEDRKWNEIPLYRFGLLFEKPRGWLAYVEMCRADVHSLPPGFDPYDEWAAEWFGTTREAVDFLRSKLAWLNEKYPRV